MLVVADINATGNRIGCYVIMYGNGVDAAQRLLISYIIFYIELAPSYCFSYWNAIFESHRVINISKMAANHQFLENCCMRVFLSLIIKFQNTALEIENLRFGIDAK